MGLLFNLLIVVIVMGLIYWIVTILPIPAPFKQIATVIVIVVCLLYLLSVLVGFAPAFPSFRHY